MHYVMELWRVLFPPRHVHLWRFYCADCARYGQHAWPSRARWHCDCGRTL